MSNEQQPVSAEVVSNIRDARVGGCYRNHPIAEADIGILLHVITERDASISQWSRMYASLISVVANTQEALGFDDDECATANGSAEIVAEIEDLKQSAADNAKCNVEAIGVIKSLRQQLDSHAACMETYRAQVALREADIKHLRIQAIACRDEFAGLTAERDAVYADLFESRYHEYRISQELAGFTDRLTEVRAERPEVAEISARAEASDWKSRKQLENQLEPRFVKIGTDGSVLDPPSTEWTAVLDNKTGLMWALETTEVGNWSKAEAAAKAVRASGFADWRLPTVEELFGLADRTRHDPAIDTDFFPGTPSDWFWCSTPHAGSPSGFAWGVDFDDGDTDCGSRSGSGFVRAVRVGQ